MITYLKHTEKLFNSLNSEYNSLKDAGVLAITTPTAFVSFLIIRLSCEFEYCVHEIVINKWKKETKSTHLHNLIQNKIKIRSSKREQLRDNLKEYLLDIGNIDLLFNSDREKNYYDKIFGKKRDETGENNIRDQLAHMIGFQFSILPQWEEMLDYIEVCDNALKSIENNLNFKI